MRKADERAGDKTEARPVASRGDEGLPPEGTGEPQRGLACLPCASLPPILEVTTLLSVAPAKPPSEPETPSFRIQGHQETWPPVVLSRQLAGNSPFCSQNAGFCPHRLPCRCAATWVGGFSAFCWVTSLSPGPQGLSLGHCLSRDPASLLSVALLRGTLPTPQASLPSPPPCPRRQASSSSPLTITQIAGPQATPGAQGRPQRTLWGLPPRCLAGLSPSLPNWALAISAPGRGWATAGRGPPRTCTNR